MEPDTERGMGDTAAGQMESYLVSNRNLDSVSEGGVGEDRQLNRQ